MSPNPKGLTSVNPEKMRVRQASRSGLAETLFRREAEGKYRWGGLPFPIDAMAQEEEMALPEYEDFVYGSCLVDREDPVAEWKRVRVEQQKVCDFLNKVSKIRVVGEDTDLSYSVKGRKWINCCGEKNMPDGEVFTAPVEDSVNGSVRFTFPGCFMGRRLRTLGFLLRMGGW